MSTVTKENPHTMYYQGHKESNCNAVLEMQPVPQPMSQLIQQPMLAQRLENQPSAFLYGICVCCSDCDSCMEAYCCYRCQMSRQCNMMRDGEAEIDWPYCLGTFIMDLFTCGMTSVIFICQTREMVRQRYGLAGNTCNDCCCSLCCCCGVLQQQLLEMTTRGEFPGACCYEETKFPHPVQLV